MKHLGVDLFVEKNRLGYKSKTKNLDKDLLKIVSENKSDIIDFLVLEQKRKLDPNAIKHTSLSQQRIWLIEKINANSGEFNISININLLGEWSHKELKSSFLNLIKQHDILRSIYLEKNEVLWQQVKQKTELPFEIIDLSEIENVNLDKSLNAYLKDCSRYQFNLANEIPIRAKFFLLPDNAKVLNLTIHHIALDDFSCQLLLKQLLTNHKTPDTSKRLPQYSEYAEWQKQSLLTKEFQERAKKYVKYLKGAPALHALPTTQAHSIKTTNRAEIVKLDVPVLLNQKISLLNQHHGLTTFAFFQTCIAKFLSIWTSTEDVVMGTPAIQRPTENSSSMLGCFLNLLVIRHQFNKNETLNDLLSHASANQNELLSYQDVPFEHLLTELKPHRTPFFTPIFQIMVSMHQQHNDDLIKNDDSIHRSWEYINQKSKTTKYDLTIKILTDGDETYLAWQYKKDLFSQKSIEQLASSFNYFLEKAIEKPLESMTKLPLSCDSRAAQLINSNSKSSDGITEQLNIVKKIELNGLKTPNVVAVEFSSKQFTYSDVISRVNYLANKLIENGVAKGDRVSVMMQRSPQMLFSMLAIMKIGAAYVPLDPDYPQERVKHIFEKSQCKILIQDVDNKDKTITIHNNTLSIKSDFYSGTQHSTYKHISNICLDDSAYIIFTSGSTGLPKGVEITHANLSNFIHSMLSSPGISQSDKLLAVTPISFDISILELFAPLVAGACVVIAEQNQRDGHSIKQRLEKNDISVMQATPATWQSVIDAKWIGNNSLKALCGGETLSSELSNKLHSKVSSLWNMYGPTETTIWSTCYPVTDLVENKISLGFPIDNTGIYVVDKHNNFCPFDKQGEIIITGAGVAKGYFNQSELTEQRFFTLETPSGPKRAYRTGDIGYISQDNKLFCHGRNDHQVKLRGFRIEIPEIEHQLMRIVGIEQVCVVVKILPSETKKLVAYVVASQISEQYITKEIRNFLPSYMLPDSVEIIDQLPLTPSGKIDRNHLSTAPFTCIEQTYLPPSNEVESLLVDIWQSCLKKEKIGITDNFFTCGGDSILAVRTVSSVLSAGYQMSNAMIFTHQTIQELALELSKEVKNIAPNNIPLVQDVNGIEVIGDAISEDDLNSLLCEFE
jgi:amino acid adenylation domain-containing protein